MTNHDDAMTFQSTRPRGARPISIVDESAVPEFQSTRPRGARPPLVRLWPRLLGFQSTRPRGARPSLTSSICLLHHVSIHAPAGGATPYLGMRQRLNQFQSTRPRGARLSAIACSGVLTPFQSTRPRGARRLPTISRFEVRNVSIHAPAGGATLQYVSVHTVISCFNPRARGGRDIPYLLDWQYFYRFQSTRPRGARPLIAVLGICERSFQSTRPRGARLDDDKTIAEVLQFQSTRPRGARP